MNTVDQTRAGPAPFASSDPTSGSPASPGLAPEPIQRRANSWRHSLLGKFTLVCLTGVIISYSVGILVGWIMITSAAKEQWNNQAQTNAQIATATLRGVYTYVSIKVDDSGQVSQIVSDRPIGDDESILFTGFSPVDVLSIIANQTKGDAWLFRYDTTSNSFETIATTDAGTGLGKPIDAKSEALFAAPDGAMVRRSGFATINGIPYYLGLLPIVTPSGKILGAIASSIGRQSDLYRTQDELLFNALITAMTVLALTGAAVTLMAKSLFAPVPALIKAVLRIADEKTDAVTPFQEREDEIGDLALAIESLREVVVERGRLREIRDMAVQLEHMAHHDPLTGLANRALLMKTLDAVAELGTHAQAFNILLLDLDRFKSVNDTLGHGVGDELLVATASRIRAMLGPDDMAARLGGDEFAVIQRVARDSQLEAGKLAARIVETMSVGFSLGGQSLAIGISIGIACAPMHGQEASFLLRNADLALYRAKAGGRGTYRFFEAGMDMAAQDLHALDHDLRSALRRDEFVLHYQPIVALGSKAVCGYEALLRWQHPQLGMVEPSRFIPLAEETGMIIPIGEWVLRRACAEAMKWPDSITIAVNMSPVQIQHVGVVNTVARALEATGLPASRLELEITETAMLTGEASIEALVALRDMGIRIALDDFGTGYASLSYLARFPYCKIKIDRSFVANLSTRSDCRTIVAAIANLAHGLGMETTAEGVETEDQLVILRAIGCTNVQGYYLGRPKPASAISFENEAVELPILSKADRAIRRR